MQGSVWKRCPCGTTGVAGRPACKKKHGSWYWRADADRDPITGERRQPGKGGYPTKELAEEARNDHLSAVQGGTWADDKSITVEMWLARWLEQCREDLDATTVAGYESHCKELIRHLGHRRLRDLRRHHIETMFREMRKPAKLPVTGRRWQSIPCDEIKGNGAPCKNYAVTGGTKCGRHGGKTQGPLPGLGRGGRTVELRQPRTLDGYRRTLRAALAAAVRVPLISQNVAEGRIDALPSIKRADTQWWEPEEVAHFLVAIANDRFAALYELAAFAGLRRGELLGLRWEDVDLTSEHPGVTIRQTLSGLAGPHDCPVCWPMTEDDLRDAEAKLAQIADVPGTTSAEMKAAKDEVERIRALGQHTGRRLKPPKNERGGRWVPLVGGTVRELLAHQAAQSSERDSWGAAYTDHGLVFAMEDGSPWRPDSVTKRFEAISDSIRFADDEVTPDGDRTPDEDRKRLTRIRLHDMRHGAASLLIAAGVPIETVAMILGHAPEVTRRIYAHVLKTPARDGMEAAEALVRGNRRAQGVHRNSESAAARSSEVA